MTILEGGVGVLRASTCDRTLACTSPTSLSVAAGQHVGPPPLTGAGVEEAEVEGLGEEVVDVVEGLGEVEVEGDCADVGG